MLFCVADVCVAEVTVVNFVEVYMSRKTCVYIERGLVGAREVLSKNLTHFIAPFQIFEI